MSMSVGNRKLSLFVKGCWNTQNSREGNPLSLEIIILKWTFWFVLNAELKLGRSYFCIIVWIDIQVSLNLQQFADISRNKTCLQRRNRQYVREKCINLQLNCWLATPRYCTTDESWRFIKTLFFCCHEEFIEQQIIMMDIELKKRFYFLSIFIGMGNGK